jgi:hypothetical protein
MKKTSLYLAPELDEALARRAADDGLSKAEFIRRALEQAVARRKRPMPRGLGSIKGGPPDLAENLEKYLDEWGFGELENA